jgi:hypothetical protein
MIVVVVVAEAFFAKVGVLESALMSGMAAVARDKDVELVGGVRVGME